MLVVFYIPSGFHVFPSVVKSETQVLAQMSQDEICQKQAYKVYNAKELEEYIDVNFSSIALNLMLEIKRFRCYKANIEKDKKRQQLLGIKPWIELPVIYH